jgi:hypothetical protein
MASFCKSQASERMLQAQQDERKPRMNYAEQRKVDMETFGGVGMQYRRNNYGGRGGGRGGGGGYGGNHGGRGSHGGGRGGRGYQNGRGGGSDRRPDQRRDPRAQQGRPTAAN